MAKIAGRVQAPSAISELMIVFGTLLAVMGLLAFGYSREGYVLIEADGAPALSGLMFFTLGSAAAALLVAFAVFLSGRRNREMANEALNT